MDTEFYLIGLPPTFTTNDISEALRTMFDIRTCTVEMLLPDHPAAKIICNSKGDVKSVLRRISFRVKGCLLFATFEDPRKPEDLATTAALAASSSNIHNTSPPTVSTSPPDSSKDVKVAAVAAATTTKAVKVAKAGHLSPINAARKGSFRSGSIDENAGEDCAPVSPFKLHPSESSYMMSSARRCLYRRMSDPKSAQQRIFKVVLTGGPCGGKSSALSAIIRKFTAAGISVFSVPEVATILINGGVSFAGLTPKQSFAYQSALLMLQLQQEKTFVDIATAHGKRSLIVCDRGTMDGKAYCSGETWDQILGRLGLNSITLRDEQYDAVLHLVTAADGAEEYYTRGNNEARWETAEEARDADQRTLQTYIGHPHLRVIDNSTDFVGKIQHVINCVSALLGLDLGAEGTGVLRRFLVKQPIPETFPVPHVDIISETYILHGSSPDNELRLVRRGEGKGVYTFFHQRARREKDGTMILSERKLTGKEYTNLLGHADTFLEKIVMHCRSFMYHKVHYELGSYTSPAAWSGTAVLRFESHTTTEADTPLPPFLTIDREITDDPAYSACVIAGMDPNNPSSITVDPFTPDFSPRFANSPKQNNIPHFSLGSSLSGSAGPSGGGGGPASPQERPPRSPNMLFRENQPSLSHLGSLGSSLTADNRRTISLTLNTSPPPTLTDMFLVPQLIESPAANSGRGGPVTSAGGSASTSPVAKPAPSPDGSTGDQALPRTPVEVNIEKSPLRQRHKKRLEAMEPAAAPAGGNLGPSPSTTSSTSPQPSPLGKDTVSVRVVDIEESSESDMAEFSPPHRNVAKRAATSSTSTTSSATKPHVKKAFVDPGEESTQITVTEPSAEG